MITKYITRNRVNSNWKNGEKVLNYSNSLTNTEDIWYKPNRWNDSSIQTVDKLGAGHNPQHQVCLQSEAIFDGLKNCFDKSKFRHFLSKINVFRFFYFESYYVVCLCCLPWQATYSLQEHLHFLCLNICGTAYPVLNLQRSFEKLRGVSGRANCWSQKVAGSVIFNSLWQGDMTVWIKVGCSFWLL